jgi:hypothetical protein
VHVDLSRLLSEGSGVVRQVVAARIRRTEQRNRLCPQMTTLRGSSKPIRARSWARRCTGRPPAATEPDRSYKFRALEQLELETKEKLRVVLERVGGSTEETAALGAAEGETRGELVRGSGLGRSHAAVCRHDRSVCQRVRVVGSRSPGAEVRLRSFFAAWPSKVVNRRALVSRGDVLEVA